MDSYYSHYQFCKCADNYRKKWEGARLSCTYYRERNWTLIGLGTAFAVLIIIVTAVAIFLLLRQRALLNKGKPTKAAGPPGKAPDSHAALMMYCPDSLGAGFIWAALPASLLSNSTSTLTRAAIPCVQGCHCDRAFAAQHGTMHDVAVRGQHTSITSHHKSHSCCSQYLSVAAAEGQAVTLVATDIEGSTEVGRSCYANDFEYLGCRVEP